MDQRDASRYVDNPIPAMTEPKVETPMFCDEGSHSQGVCDHYKKVPTPRTDAALITVMHRLTAMQHVEGKAVSVEFARQLETELAEARELLRDALVGENVQLAIEQFLSREGK